MSLVLRFAPISVFEPGRHANDGDNLVWPLILVREYGPYFFLTTRSHYHIISMHR